MKEFTNYLFTIIFSLWGSLSHTHFQHFQHFHSFHSNASEGVVGEQTKIHYREEAAAMRQEAE